MGAFDLLQHLRSAGLVVTADGDRLTVAPRARLTDDLRDRIKAQKTELLAALAVTMQPTSSSCVPTRCHNSSAMCDAEIDRFQARLNLFAGLRMGDGASDALADKLLARDRSLDDRVTCLECAHIYRRGSTWSCNQWRLAGLGAVEVPADLVQLMQRCIGFSDGTT